METLHAVPPRVLLIGASAPWAAPSRPNWRRGTT